MKKHQDPRWQKLLREHKPVLLARLPHPCPRCGQPMSKGMRLDLGHISRHPSLTFERGNLRLEHASCNRRDGQRVATASRLSRKARERMPTW